MSMRTSTSVSRRGFVKTAGIAAGAVAAAGVAGTQAMAKEGPSFTAETPAATPSFFVKPDPITDVAETKDYDVVVIGAGAAGVCAALSANDAGAKVALLQKEETAISQGNTGSGIDLDTSDPAGVEALISTEIAENGYRPKRELLRNWAYNSGEAVKWMIAKAEKQGAQVVDQGDQQQKGIVNVNGYELHYVTLFFGPKPYNTGDGVIALAKEAEAEGVEIFYSTPAVQLVGSAEEGGVTGVIGQDADGKHVQFNAKKGVIVATGDYQNNTDMCEYYLPDLRNMERKQFNKTGDGQRMIVWAGGKMEDLNHTKMLHDFDAGPASMCDMPFLAVKDDGSRFCNETTPMSIMNNYLRGPQDCGWYSQIFDADYMTAAADWPGKLVDPDAMVNWEPEVDGDKEGVYPGLIGTYVADTIEELAEKLEIDPEALKATVDRYNELCEKGADEDFGKPAEYLAPVKTPPFYGIHRHVRISALVSGVDVDVNNQCLTPEGEPIPGLYAIGNCAGNFYGGVDYPLKVYGLSLGRCYTAGYMCGKYVAAL